MTKVTVDSEFRVQIPQDLRDGFSVGCIVSIEVDAEARLLISPHKYALTELVAETPPDSIILEWEDMPSVGRESE